VQQYNQANWLVVTEVLSTASWLLLNSNVVKDLRFEDKDKDKDMSSEVKDKDKDL